MKILKEYINLIILQEIVGNASNTRGTGSVREFPVTSIKQSNPEKIHFTGYITNTGNGFTFSDVSSGKTIARAKSIKELSKKVKKLGYKYYINTKHLTHPSFYTDISLTQ